MMFGPRLRVTGQLKLVSNLQIGGAGGTPLLTASSDKDRKTPTVSEILRGTGGRPVIPATTLKGHLRAAAERIEGFDIAQVFGAIGDTQDGEQAGTVGCFWIANALMSKPVSDTEAIVRETHVAIEGRTGAADPNKLFQREMVTTTAPTFKFSADWFGDPKAQELANLLGLLCDGVEIGRGTNKGHGRIRLISDSVKIHEGRAQQGRLSFDQAWSSDSVDQFLNQAASENLNERIFALTLTCNGPFISMVPQAKGSGARSNEIQPFTRDSKPYIYPESIIGAMRSRATWLGEVIKANAKGGGDPTPIEDIASELFGSTSCKGFLAIRNLKCKDGATPLDLTSTSIDRFAGGGRDGALYREHTYDSPIFTAELVFDRARSEKVGDHTARAEILARLLKELQGHGLELGHGASKGFGWCDVSLEEKEQPSEPT